MSYVNKQRAIEEFKKRYPEIAIGKSDERIYNLVSASFNPETVSGVEGSVWGPWIEKKEKDITKPSHPASKHYSTNPKEWYEHITNANLAGWIGDAFDINFAKYSAMQGSTDIAHAAITGESGYTLRDSNGKIITAEQYEDDLNVLQEVLAWTVGQINPIDAAVWGMTFGTGKLATWGLTRTVGKAEVSWMRKQMLESSSAGVKKFAKSDNAFSTAIKGWVDRMPSSAISLGTMSASTGTIHDAYRQRMLETDAEGRGIGEVDMGEAMMAGGWAGIEGGILGVFTAGVPGAISTPLAKGAARLERSGGAFKNKVADIMKSKYTQVPLEVGAEGGVFGLGAYALPNTDIPRNEDGSVNWGQVRHDWLHATATIGVLRTTFHHIPKMYKRLKGEVDQDSLDALLERARGGEGKNGKETVEGTVTELERLGLQPDIISTFIKDITDVELKNKIKPDGVEFRSKKALMDAIKKADKYKDILLDEKYKDVSDRDLLDVLIKDKKLTDKDIKIISSEVLPALLITKQHYANRIKNKKNFDEYLDIYESENFKKENNGKEWTTEERDTASKYIKGEIKRQVNAIENMRDSMRNNLFKPSEKRKKIISDLEKEILELEKDIPGILDIEKQQSLSKAINEFKKAKKAGVSVKELESHRDRIKEEFEARTPEERLETAVIRVKSGKIPKGYTPATWKKHVDSLLVPGNVKKSLKQLKIAEEQQIGIKAPGKLKSKTVDVEKFKESKKGKTEVVKQRIDDLADVQNKIEADSKVTYKGKKGTAEYDSYQTSYQIIKDFIQNIFPEQTRGTGGAYVKDIVKRAKSLHEIAKSLAEKNYNFRDMTNDQARSWIKTHTKDVTLMNQLIIYLTSTRDARGNVLNDVLTSMKVKKPTGDIESGTIKHEGQAVSQTTFVEKVKNVLGSTIRYWQTKKDAFADKPITKKTADIINTLIDKAKTDKSAFYLRDINGDALMSKHVAAFIKDIFGIKPVGKGESINRKLGRAAIMSWAEGKFGPGSKESSLILVEILKDPTSAATDTVSKAYAKNVNKQSEAAKLVKRYLKEIQSDKKHSKSEDYYNPNELKAGLDKIKKIPAGGLEIQITKTKSITISKETAEGISNLIIETSPRFNELVPSSKKMIQQAEKIEAQREAEGRTEFMTGKREGQRAATETEKSRVRKFVKKYFPEVLVEFDKKKLVDEKGKVVKSEDVLETYLAGVVMVKKGAPVEAAVHGVSHHALQILESIGKSKKYQGKNLGKTALKLQQEAYRRARKHENFTKWRDKYLKEGLSNKEATDRALQEVTAELVGEYMAGRVTDKTTFKAIGDWIKRVYRTFNTAFKKIDKLSNEEVTALLGEKILKRKTAEIPIMSYAREVGGRMEFMTAKANEPKKMADLLRKQVVDFINASPKYTLSDYDMLRREIALDAYEISNPTEFKLKGATLLELSSFAKAFGRLDVGKMQAILKKKHLFEWMGLRRSIRANRVPAGVHGEIESNWLKDQGIKSGKLDDVTDINILRDWHSTLFEMATDNKGFGQTQSELSFLMESDNFAKLKLKLKESVLGSMRRFSSTQLLGFAKFSKSIGLNELSKWTYRHIAAEQSYVGPFTTFIDIDAANIIGKSSWKKLSPVFNLIEAAENGSFIRINDKTVNQKKVGKAKAFVKKAFKVKIKKDKSGKEKWYNDGINWDPKTNKGTKEGQLAYHFRELLSQLPAHFEMIASVRFNKAKYEQLIKENDIKFLNKSKKAFYIPRRMTKDFGQRYDIQSNKEAKAISVRAKEIAYKDASDTLGKKFINAPRKEQQKMMDEFIEKSEIIASAEFYTNAEFGSGKVTLKNLITRNKFKLDETVKTKDGKKVEVWETDIESVLLPFATGWGKLLANMSHAPWAVGLKGYSDANIKAVIKEFTTAKLKGDVGKGFRRVIQRGIERRVGSFVENTTMPGFHEGMRDYTATLMRLQLAGPLPLAGIKNYFEQAKMMVQAFPLFEVITAHMKAFSAKERRETERLGAVSSIGVLGYKPQYKILKDGVLEYVFKSGGMPLTESFGRTWARLAADMDAKRMETHLRTMPETSRAYKYAENRFKQIYELTDTQVKLVKDYGLEPVLDNVPMGERNFVKMEMKDIVNQIQITGNMKTAGSTVDAMMPELMNKKFFKPLLMYKRIAYTATINTGEMMKYNLKNGHLMRIGMHIGGTYIAGSVRIGLLKGLLGQTIPDENSNEWKALRTIFWQGEALGILSEFFSPYFWGGNADSIFSMDDNALFQAAVITHAKQTIMTGIALGKIGFKELGFDVSTPKTTAQTLKELGRASSSSYNQFVKFMELRNNEYNRNGKAISKWRADFEGKHGYRPNNDYEAMEADKYMRDVKTAFNLGKMDELNEAVTLAFFAKAADLRHGTTGMYKMNAALNKAAQIIKTRFTTLNPVQYSMNPNDDWAITPLKAFFMSLDKDQMNTVAKTYAQYEKKHNAFWKQYQYYLRKQNLDEFINKFDYKMRPELRNVIKDYMKNLK